MKKIYAALLLLCLTVLSLTKAEAKEQLTVNWSPNVYAVTGDATALRWLDSGAREKIASAITRKLHALQAEGKLPFALRESNGDYSLQQKELGPVLGLVPAVLLGRSVDTAYQLENGESYYRSVIMSGLSFFLCSVDEDYDAAGRPTASYRVLGMLPLYSYDTIGGDLNNLRTTPLSDAEKAACYTQATVATIEKYLDFASQKNIVRNLNSKQMFSDDLYQVSEVNISANLIHELFGSNEDSLASAIGYFYTGAYQQTTKRLMLPPLAGHSGIHDDIVDNLYSLSLDSPGSRINMTMPKAKNSIRLNLTGAACGEINPPQRAPQTRYIGYQLWLAQSPAPKPELMKQTQKDFRVFPLSGDTSVITRDDKDVFSGMAIELALKMGTQKG